MSGDILTHWGLVLQWERPATADVPTLITAEDVFADARTAYLDRCAVLTAYLRDQEAEVRTALGALRTAAPADVLTLDEALVGISVVEVGPSSFEMAVRIRPAGTGAHPVDIRRTLVVARLATGERLPIPGAVRDEFIALQLAARDIC